MTSLGHLLVGAPFGEAGQLVGGHGQFIIDGSSASFLAALPYTYSFFGIGPGGTGTGVIRNGARADFRDVAVGSNYGAGTLSIESGADVSVATLTIGFGGFVLDRSRPNRAGDGTVILNGGTLRPSFSSAGNFINVGTISTYGGSGRLVVNAGTLD